MFLIVRTRCIGHVANQINSADQENTLLVSLYFVSFDIFFWSFFFCLKKKPPLIANVITTTKERECLYKVLHHDFFFSFGYRENIFDGLRLVDDCLYILNFSLDQN